jgi:GntR family transcriptional regulator/MocR family aminotransferase
MPRTPLLLRPPDPSRSVPLFAQIANAIAGHIRSGRLVSGDVLPGSRALARDLGVDRDTIIQAYSDLEAQGFLIARSRQGMVVAEVPARVASGTGVGRRLGFALDRGTNVPTWSYALPADRRGMLVLAGAVPDLRLVPAELVARAYRRAIRRHGARVLGYSTEIAGHPRLRAAVARLVRETRGIAASPDHVLISRGSQMGIDLLARALVRPGDVACVEALGYRMAWASLERAGARLIGVPVDAHGLDVEALARICERTHVRLVYLTPHHHYPTTVVLSAGRRMQLLQLAARKQIAILEDDYDHETHYEGRPVLPLASQDGAGVVAYIGTLSKVLAPGLRLGFVVAPRLLIDRLARERYLSDHQGDHALEAAIAELIEDDELGRHIRKMRRIYHVRRDALADALARSFGDRLVFTVPSGGMALWVEVVPPLDPMRWLARAAERGVLFQPGRDFALAQRTVRAARFGFAACDEAELATAVRKLVEAAGMRTRT